MSKIICFNHPNYEATKNPNLTCTACCTKYVDFIRLQQRYAQNTLMIITETKSICKSINKGEQHGI